MTFIREVSFESGPFASPLLVSSCPEEHLGNWITVYIGKNSSGKSLLLRCLSEFAVGRDKVLSRNRGPVKLAAKLERASKVIALSGTPLDRFPRSSVPGFARRKPTQFDRKPFVYLGQRAPNGVVGAGQSERMLAALLLRNAKRLSERQNPLQAAFEALNLEQQVSFRLTRAAGINIEGKRRQPLSEDDLRKKLTALRAASEPPFTPLPFEGGEHELMPFVDWALGEKGWRTIQAALEALDSSEEAFVLSPEAHTPGRLPTITDWRCALALGLADIESLSFWTKSGERRDGEELSSGQWNWLTSMSGIALESEDQCLILVDEPENSLHPEWQRRFVESLRLALQGRKRCQVVIATHSPLVASGVEEASGDVYAIGRSEGEDSKIAASPRPSTFGWTASDVYEFYFDMESTRAPDFLNAADHALSLVREGAQQNAAELRQVVPALQATAATLPQHDVMRSVVDALGHELNRVTEEDGGDRA